MRASQYLIATLKETPADAEIISHQLMLRAGMVRKLASGLYTWLPLGLRVLRRVEAVVREEMNTAGALEVLMPAVQPAELWQESGRWQEYGDELLRVQDRHQRDFCVGPTHEEVITDLARREIRSYKQLPVNFYQVQTKFRDERRPRFGVMRAREFIMKDAYSFHLDAQSLAQTYERMHDAYSRIFTRLGLDFRAVRADSGAIGGSWSHEFHVLAASGEDAIAFSDASDYAANIEAAECPPPADQRPAPAESLRLVDTPGARTIAHLVDDYGIPVEKTVKTLIVAASEACAADFLALMVRGDDALNEVKAEKLPQVASPLRMATEEEIRASVGAGPGSLGPVNLPLPLVVDHRVALMADFSAGANKDDQHYLGINWERDLPLPATADLRTIREGEPSPCGQGQIRIKRGIEVGHIFQLGTKYSESMSASVLDESGKAVPMPMGCYGIGVTRVVAAAIEQNHDDRGIIWPQALAPFDIALVPMNADKSAAVQSLSESLYQELLKAGYQVLLDDRKERPGAKFADLELMGIPHRLVISERGLKAGTLEYKGRTDDEATHVPEADVMAFLHPRLSAS